MATKNIGIYETIVNLTSDVGQTIVKGIYDGCANVYTSSISYTLFGLSVVIWGFFKIRGDWSREDLFKGMMFCLIFIIIQASLSSYENYQSVLNVFKLPYHWFNAGISTFTSGSIGLSDMTDHIFSAMGDTISKVAQKTSWYDIQMWLLIFLFAIVCLIFTIMLLVFTVLSQFMANIILSLAVLVFPLIAWQQTRGVFISWLKLYISLSLWAPFAILLSAIPMATMESLVKNPLMEIDIGSLLPRFFVPIILFAFSIFLLSKIPGWVSAIIGSADSSGSGSGVSRVFQSIKNAGEQFVDNAKEGQSKSESLAGAIGAGVGGKVGNASAQWAGAQAHKFGSQILKAGKFVAKHMPHFHI